MTLRKLVTAALLLIPHAAFAADASVEAFEAAQQQAWNAHDAAAYAAAMDDDVSVVTAQGWHWTGRADAARNLADGFKLVYARARLTTSDVEARAVTPELASVTLRWSIEGARTIDGGAPAGEQQGYRTQLLQRRGSGWAILSQQDTPVLAPMPVQPASPGVAAPAPTAFPTTPPPVRRCILARGNGECLIYGKPRPAPGN